MSADTPWHGVTHFLDRYPVPGGWLYRLTVTGGVGLTFVPDVSAAAPVSEPSSTDTTTIAVIRGPATVSVIGPDNPFGPYTYIIPNGYSFELIRHRDV